ncbi:CvpA family protein [Teredinibacter sp. KSP-S5-2]|uniref:CvpA family protein n=1 Tax=Teredinibacter sp. KSP-S5-2 TaxID=3034506 RepID=UPI0029350C34|nr:CvpA family protein [Teredinibacter sp. KSP-S5-2]WNO10159.1 CvpA family protein [Teredinibacter sp. KSP-S5-2]
MPENITTLLFVSWVIWGAIRGYFKGSWLSFFSVLGVVAAYVACVVLGRPLVDILQEQGFSPLIAALVVLPCLFFSVQLFVSSVPNISPLISKNKGQLPALGAVIGAGVNVVSGLVFVWFIDFALSLKDAPSDAELSHAEVVVDSPSSDQAIRQVASKAMETAAYLGSRATGKDEEQAKIIAVMTSKPAKTVTHFQGLAKSEELKRLVQNPQAQYLMATNNTGALKKLPEFSQLMSQPDMVGMAKAFSQEKNKDPEQFVADNFSWVWRRMQYLKNDTRVKAILSDEEVRTLIEKQNTAELLLNAKIHQLISIVLDDPKLEGVDYTQFVNQAEDGDAMLSRDADPAKSNPIYKWVSEAGTTKYTHWEDIPENKKSQAVLMTE